MEGISVNAYKGIKRYWKRKNYQRLNTNTNTISLRPYRKVRVQLSRFTQPSQSPSPQTLSSHPTPTSVVPNIPLRRRRRFWRWRVKISPKIRLISPRKWLTRLRDAYVNMMLKFANSAVFRGGYGGVGYGGGNGGGFSIKEYDERMLVEIYKSVLMAQQQSGHQVVVDAKAGKFGGAGHQLVTVGR